MRTDFELPKPTIKAVKARERIAGFSPLQRKFLLGQKKLIERKGYTLTAYRRYQLIEYIDAAMKLAYSQDGYELFK